MSRHLRLAWFLVLTIAVGLPLRTVAQQRTGEAIDIQSLEQLATAQPGNPELCFTITTHYWDRAFRGESLSESQRRELIAKGLQFVDRALGLKPAYREALVYTGLLLRLQASLEADPLRQQALIREADGLRDTALTLPFPQ